MTNDITGTVARLERVLRHKQRLEGIFHKLNLALSGAEAEVRELQTRLRNEWNSRRLWSNATSPEATAMRHLLDRLETLKQALLPERQSTIVPPAYLPGNSPYKVSTKYDPTTGVLSHDS